MSRMGRGIAVAAMSLALGLLSVGVADTAANATPTAQPAMVRPASTENGCVNNPSNGNCDGVWISESGPCWASSYIVAPSSGGEYFFNDGDWHFETDLRYSRSCRSNFSVTTLLSTGVGFYQFSGKVRRFAGPDGAYLMEHGGWYTANQFQGGATVISPLVWSPDNTASACFSNRTSDQVGCTGVF